MPFYLGTNVRNITNRDFWIEHLLEMTPIGHRRSFPVHLSVTVVLRRLCLHWLWEATFPPCTMGVRDVTVTVRTTICSLEYFREYAIPLIVKATGSSKVATGSMRSEQGECFTIPL